MSELVWNFVAVPPSGPLHLRRGKLLHAWTGVRKRLGVSEDIKKNPWQIRCPAPMCFLNLTAKTEKDATRILETHVCPWYGGGDTTRDWSVMSEQYLVPIWKLLDDLVDRINDPNEIDREAVKHQARGVANTLAILMPPFFYASDEIVKEAVRRHKARVAGEDYETPGIGRFRLKVPASEEHILRNTGQKVAGPAKVAGPEQLANALTSEQKAGITAALGSGLFTAEQLASTYKVSVAVIESLA